MTQPNPIPSGALMQSRQLKVKEKLEHLLPSYPPAKGDDTLDTLRYWAKIQPMQARAAAWLLVHWADNKEGKEQVPKWVFKGVLMLTTPESIRRRRQELQAPEKEAVQSGRMELKDAKYLPREETMDKRQKLELAMYHEFSGAGLQLIDRIQTVLELEKAEE